MSDLQKQHKKKQMSFALFFWKLSIPSGICKQALKYYCITIFAEQVTLSGS